MALPERIHILFRDRASIVCKDRFERHGSVRRDVASRRCPERFIVLARGQNVLDVFSGRLLPGVLFAIVGVEEILLTE